MTHKPILETWFKGVGSAHIFIYYQKPYKLNDQGECVEPQNSREEFFITDGTFPLNLNLRSLLFFLMLVTLI